MFVHVGQCGNQVGLPLWQLAEAEAGPSPEERRQHPMFCEERGFARAIFVDSEPKVTSVLVGTVLRLLLGMRGWS